MSYIWEKYSSEKHFRIGARVCPYLEVFENDLDYIEVNPMIRFSEIIDLETMKYDNNGDIQNVVFHYLAQLDRVKGMCSFQALEEKIRNEIEKGYWGEVTAIAWNSLTKNDQEIILCDLAQRLLNDNQTYFMETVGKLFSEASLCYEEKTELYYLYIKEEESNYNKQLLEIVRYLFWNMNKRVLVVWKYHYGIIGCEDSMHVDFIQII